MRRILFALAAVLVLAGAGLARAQSEPSDYPTNPDGTTPTQATLQVQGATPSAQEPTTSPTQGSATMSSDPGASTTSDPSLPATAGPLPLMALFGLTALAAGMLLSRRRA